MSNEFLDIPATAECGFTLKHLRVMTRIYSQMHHTDMYSEHSLIILPVSSNGSVFVYEPSFFGVDSSCSHLKFRFHTCFEQELLEIQETTECGFTLKRVRDITRTYSQMHGTDTYSEQSSMILPVWPNG